MTRAEPPPRRGHESPPPRLRWACRAPPRRRRARPSSVQCWLPPAAADRSRPANHRGRRGPPLRLLRRVTQGCDRRGRGRRRRCVLLAVFIISFLLPSEVAVAGHLRVVDVSPVSTLAAPGIAAPSVVGKRPTPSPLRGSPPPRALRPTGALLTPPREGGGGEFPS